jgi:HD-like signal output (HDOD) protein
LNSLSKKGRDGEAEKNMLSLERLLRESERIEPVPQVIHQLMGLVDDPEVPVSEITELILYEPVVTANLLKTANSAAFGFKKKVASVHDAVVLLGLKRVVEIVLLNSVTKPLKSAQQGYGLEAGQLWKQSVSCALMAGAIAETIEPSVRHIVFTAALLKDIGIIVMNRHVSDAMTSIRRAMDIDNLGLVAAERKVLGIDHAYLGGRIATNWRFSETLAATIGDHHLAEGLENISDETAMVYLADSMCSMAGINGDLFCDHYVHYDQVCRQLRLSELDANRIMSDFFSRKEDIYGLLSIL